MQLQEIDVKLYKIGNKNSQFSFNLVWINYKKSF